MDTAAADSARTRAERWTTPTRTFDIRRNFVIAGILNVTPDSFYDGGRYAAPAAALERARRMIADGADLIDVGGESTRPGAADVSDDEQIRRISAVIESLADDGIIISADTRRAAVARRALERGASIINDVSGLEDSAMADIVAGAGAALVIMHMRGTPRDMQENPNYGDPVGEIAAWLEERCDRARAAGVAADSICIDPGIGFGKRVEDNLRLINEAEGFSDMGFGVMFGISRKSFLGAIGAGATPEERLVGTLAASVVAYLRGVRIFRTHDPLETRRALSTVAALHGTEPPR